MQNTNPKQVIPKSVIAWADKVPNIQRTMTSQEIAMPNRPHASQSKTLRVLCAEDDKYLALMLKCVLEQAGHFVECVEDGQKALQRITSDLRFFDVLVTDNQMPVLSGLGLVSKLRDTEFSGAIVVHSSHLSDAEADAYRALAVDHILSKPIQLPTLLGVVQELAETMR